MENKINKDGILTGIYRNTYKQKMQIEEKLLII